MTKDSDAQNVVDPNEDGMVQAPPPSYTTNSAASKSYQPPAGPPPTSFYQAQPVGQQTYTPPEGAYMPPSSSSGYAPPAGNPGGANPSTVVYVVDGNDPVTGDQMSSKGVPVAMYLHLVRIPLWNVFPQFTGPQRALLGEGVLRSCAIRQSDHHLLLHLRSVLVAVATAGSTARKN
ncbi:hypothetical protein EC957_002842 [Mortierella hygrophila]|uniref:Uncharacterized protein n=1 Tax=Mortierella hygrophila TaxID=979708 RepID=A0A9P6FG14_9FUNG|nr:hypothetical protein EC957_002842 [Mortierella hygrophila]